MNFGDLTPYLSYGSTGMVTFSILIVHKPFLDVDQYFLSQVSRTGLQFINRLFS
jgi:hypothetical protein